MNTTNILIILATLLGPILAVQAQKFLEAARERRNKKLWLFHTLMATRATRLSPDHVQALNMIDLTFYGKRILWANRRTKKEQMVLDSWREYLDHLDTKFGDGQFENWRTRGDELFVNLLHAIAQDVHFVFDRVQLKKNVYLPVAHGRIEEETDEIRRLAIAVLSGKSPLSMSVDSFPVDPDALKAQVELQRSMTSVLDGDGALRVVIRNDQQTT